MTHEGGHRVLRHADRSPAPWRNRGGVTYEVARCPDGDGDIDWRLSVAEVAAEGPFSSFPGIDRVLILLGGTMRLVIEGVAYDVPPFEPLAFAGEAHVESILPSGPTMDLNVMTRRGRVRADIEIITGSAVTLAAAPGSDLMVVVLAGSWVVGNDLGLIGPYDCVTVDGGVSLTQRPADPGALACITLTSKPRSYGGAQDSQGER